MDYQQSNKIAFHVYEVSGLQCVENGDTRGEQGKYNRGEIENART